MTSNPILLALSREVSGVEWPVSTVSVLAPLISGASTLRISWAKYEDSADLPDMPAGVSARVIDKVPDTIMDLPAMVAVEQMVTGAAWAYGAWDIARHVTPAGYAGLLPGYVDEAMRMQGFVDWSFRPMLAGPEIRQIQKKPDVTLDQWTRGRAGPPPNVTLPPMIPWRAQVIRLGQTQGDDHNGGGSARKYRSRAVRPATIGQMRFLAFLHRVNKLPMPPEKLGFWEASALIDKLKGGKHAGD